MAIVLLAGALLMLDLAPAVPRAPPPTGAQAQRSRDAYRLVRDALSSADRPAQIRISVAALNDVTGLVSRLERIGRVGAVVHDGTLRLRASRRLLGPIWINGYADVAPSARGFPPVSLWIGRLPLGRTLSRYVIDASASFLRARGVRLPPLDTAVRAVRIEPAAVAAMVDFPLGSGILSGAPELRLGPIDARAAAGVSCRLVTAARTQPANTLAEIVRRAFATPAGTDPVAANRARLVAIAMYVAEPTAVRVAPEVRALARSCGQPGPTPTLIGREDLAKHWALSAALTVTVGDDVSHAMGEWKELADSRPHGSGFSFVDLSADRSGIAVGQRAMEPGQAAAFAERMAQVQEQNILPTASLAMAEGLTEQQFVARYGNVDSAIFAAAVARIDRVLAGTIGE